MIAKKSILKLEGFSIIKSICESHPFIDFPENMSDYMQNYQIDLEFDILTVKNESEEIEETHLVSVKIEINKEKKSGYYILVEGTGIYSLPKNIGLSEENKANLLLSGVNMCITNLRGYISNITSSFPYGQYFFPAIDMNDLIEQKRNSKINQEDIKG